MADESFMDRVREYAAEQVQMFGAELGALGRQELNDARNAIMGEWGEGEKTPGTIGYPTQQMVTESFEGSYDDRLATVSGSEAGAQAPEMSEVGVQAPEQQQVGVRAPEPMDVGAQAQEVQQPEMEM